MDPEWEAFIKNRAALKAVTTAEVDMPDGDSMVQYGGFISDNEDEAVEASAIKVGGVKSKKPVKGLYARITLLGSLQVTHSFQTHSPLFRSKQMYQKR